jgi:hypothetical protein
MVGVFANNLDGDEATRRKQALALVSTCVGGMVLARAVADKDLANELRNSARQSVFASAGWPMAETQE